MKQNIYKESDFKLRETLPDNMLSVHFEFIYFVYGGKTKYTASFDGTTYANCVRDGNAIVVCFNAPQFSVGTLNVIRKFDMPDSDFEDGKFNMQGKFELDVRITGNAADLPIGEISTEVPPVWSKGADGDSAYQIAVKEGFTGTQQEWLQSLVGPKGDKGDDGKPGAPGKDGQGALTVDQATLLGTAGELETKAKTLPTAVNELKAENVNLWNEVGQNKTEIAQLGNKIGNHTLSFNVVSGAYINTSTSININKEIGDKISVRLNTDASIIKFTIAYRNEENKVADFIKIAVPNKTYVFDIIENTTAILIYTARESDVATDGPAELIVCDNIIGIIDAHDKKIEVSNIRATSATDKKLFNEIPYKSGSYVNRTGGLTEDSSGYYTDLIPVTNGDSFSYTGKALYGNPCLYTILDFYGNVIEFDNTIGDYENKKIVIANGEAVHIRFGSYITVLKVKRITDNESIQTYVDKKADDIYNAIQSVNERVDASSLTTRLFNLFSRADATEGKYIQGGTIKDDANHILSDYIPVVVGEKYTFPVDTSFFGVSIAANIPIFDSAKKYIGDITGILNGIMLTITTNNPNVAYIRTNLKVGSRTGYKWKQSADTYMVVNSDTYPDRYYPYGEILQYPDGEFQDSFNSMTNPLFGKSIIFDGDSICAANDDDNKYGWAGRIGVKNCMMWQNLAVGGGTFTNGGWGTHVISETDYGDANPDYIIIEGATNDADIVGSILGEIKPDKYGTFSMSGYDTGFTNDTFCGAVEALFKKLLTNYPSSKIGVIIAQKMGVSNNYTATGNNRRAYFETLILLCEKWGIPYINLWDTARLNPKLPSFYKEGSADSFYTDGQHLTANGYKVITPIIEEWMKTL